MNAQEGGRNLGRGVYFAPRDCAGLPRRLLIIVIDFLVIVMVGVAIHTALVVARPDLTSRNPIPGLAWWGFAYLYLTLLRGSRFRTLGYS